MKNPTKRCHDSCSMQCIEREEARKRKRERERERKKQEKEQLKSMR